MTFADSPLDAVLRPGLAAGGAVLLAGLVLASPARADSAEKPTEEELECTVEDTCPAEEATYAGPTRRARLTQFTPGFQVAGAAHVAPALASVHAGGE